MRNLKKILALVLALVMSLSLMATASATEFPDDGEIDDTYRVAVEVLSGLNVFAGDQNGKFNPKDPIRRSEVAAIIYRIATGDVTNERNNSYTPYNQFSDVITGDWFAGYVTYCANAGYIKGRNDGKFDPYANVTGYEVLAMILRAVGYDKNNEFVGSNWQLNTASIAQEKGVLKNITGATKLSEPATRETVAELLFRSILLPKVTWNANTLSYTDGTTPLATETLGLEEITGVVMANQWADLESGSVMADGKTRLKVDGKDYSIDYTSALTDIGESRHAYIQGSKVFVLDDTGSNVVKDNEGAETTVDALRGSLSIKDAEYFINFSDAEINESEWLIRYAVTVGTVDTAGNFLSYEPWYASTAGTLTSYGRYLNRELGDDYTLYTPATLPNINPVRRAAVETRDVTNADGSISRVLTVSIQPGAVINDFDQDLMRRIFYTADRFASNPTTSGSTVVNVDYYVRGEVYVGTTSLEDKSDIMSWNQFVDTYIKASPATKITAVGNGNWLKIIDNNNDGKAEYVLETRYTLDEVVNSATKDSTTTYYYRDLDIDAYKPVYLNDYSPAVGDIVLYARIDGTAQMHLADTSSTAFRAVNYKERQATDTDGKVWEQSDIYNKTLLPGDLTKVDENVTYTIYLDDYGYVRAYDNKTTYALVTEIYPTNTMNQAWLTGHDLTAEVMTAEDGVVREYNLVNSWYANGWNPFFDKDGWFYDGINDGWLINGSQTVVGRPNYLTHATGALDTKYQNNVFTYSSDPATTTWHPWSWTNVAKYTMTGDGINLTTAADYDQSTGSTIEDYVQLKVADAKPSNPLYEINDARWTGAGNDYVRAVDDTEFFVVAKDGIKHYTGYTKIPALTVSGNGIRAMYAVAEKVKSDLNQAEYWVANVIVIEMDHFSANWDSVALIYSNDYKISGDVKYLQALDSKRGDIGIIPNNWTWQGQFNNRGFYALSNVVATETEGLYRADVEQLYGASRARAVDSYANLSTTYGIHYGKVRSFNGELSRSSYITVDLYTGDDANGKHLYGGGANTTSIRLAADYGSVWGINGSVDRANTALDLILDYHANKQVQVGDEIVWVETSAGVAGFVVDLTDCDAGTFGTTYRDWWWTPEWLWDKDDNGIVTANCEVYYVMKDQIAPAAGSRTVFGSFYGEEFGLDANGNPFNSEITVPYAQAKVNKFELYENAGYTFTVSGGKVELTENGAVYYVVAAKDGTNYTFTLTQEEAAKGTQLTSTKYIDATGTLTFPSAGNVALYLKNFTVSERAAAVWHFFDLNGVEHTAILESGKEPDVTGLGNLEDLSSFQTEKTYVIVTAESGATATYKAAGAVVPENNYDIAMAAYETAINADPQVEADLLAALTKLNALTGLDEEKQANVEAAKTAINEAVAALVETSKTDAGTELTNLADTAKEGLDAAADAEKIAAIDAAVAEANAAIADAATTAEVEAAVKAAKDKISEITGVPVEETITLAAGDCLEKRASVHGDPTSEVVYISINTGDYEVGKALKLDDIVTGLPTDADVTFDETTWLFVDQEHSDYVTVDYGARTITFNAPADSTVTLSVACLDLGWTQTQTENGGDTPDNPDNPDEPNPITPGEGDTGVDPLSRAARTGETILEHGKRYRFWFRIDSDIEIDRVTLNGEDITSDVAPYDGHPAEGKTTYAFAAAYNAFKGVNIAIYPKAQPIDGVEVVVRKNDANVTLVNNGSDVTGNSYPAIAADGKVTVTVKLASTVTQRPVVVLSEDNVIEFTQNTEDNTWTAQVPVTAETTSVTVTLASYWKVLVEGKDADTKAVITVDNPEQYVRENGSAEVNITIPAGKALNVTGIADSVEYTLTEGENNVWTLTFAEVTAAITAKVGLTAPRTIVLTGDANCAIVGETEVKNWAESTYTVVVDAKDGYQPQTGSGQNLKYFAIAENQGDVAAGYTRWEYEAALVSTVTQITVTGTAMSKLTLSCTQSQVKIPAASNAYIVSVSGESTTYTATVEGVSVKNGFTISNDNCTCVNTGVEDENNAGFYLWTVTWTGSSKPQAAVSLTCNASKTVTATATADVTINGESTKNADNSEAYYSNSTTNTAMYASFDVTVASNMMPIVTGSAYRVTPKTGTTWTVDVKAGDSSVTAVSISAVRKPMAVLEVPDSNGIDLNGNSYGYMTLTPVETAKDANSGENTWAWSNACPLNCEYTFKGIKATLTDGSSTMLTAAKAQDSQAEVTVTPEYIASSYDVKVTQKWTPSTTALSIPVTLSVNKGTKVTLAAAEGTDGVTIDEAVKYSTGGSAVTFTVTLAEEAAGSTVKVTKTNNGNGTAAVAENTDGTWTVTVTGATSDSTFEVSLVSGEAFSYNVALGNSFTGVYDLVGTTNGTSSSDIDFDIVLDNNYILVEDESNGWTSVTVTLYDTTGNAIETAAQDGDAPYTVAIEHTSGTTWHCTVSVTQPEAEGEDAEVQAIGRVVVEVGNATAVLTADETTGNYAAKAGEQETGAHETVTATLASTVPNNAVTALDVVVEKGVVTANEDDSTYTIVFTFSPAEEGVNDGYALELSGTPTNASVSVALGKGDSGESDGTIVVTLTTDNVSDSDEWVKVTKGDGDSITEVKLLKNLTFSVLLVEAEEPAA